MEVEGVSENRAVHSKMPDALAFTRGSGRVFSFSFHRRAIVRATSTSRFLCRFDSENRRR